VREHEVEESLLLARELSVDGDLGAGAALLASLGWLVLKD